ncbi:MAG: hypothetical protein GF346_01100 [Candidatus Eisenbacteria bacterium]|nr:hypothetical protein [Candidatus Latescibacterota bacterium]MBD3301029.1 hypothetical protein [Candidatus Eisenbacteria bacterium]
MLLPVLAALAQPPEDVAAYDTTTVGRATGFDAPVWVMFRSAVVPGWGQVHNGRYVKAALLGGTECAFLYGIFREDHLADEAGRKAIENPAEAAYWRSVSDRHRDRKRSYLWWGAFTALLSIGDAYVDAHLQGFNVEFREEDQALLLGVEVYP